MKGSPMQRNYGIASPAQKNESDQENLTKLVNTRTELRAKEAIRNEKRASGKTVLFGNLKTKINTKKQDKNQAKINANATAQSNANAGKNTSTLTQDERSSQLAKGASDKKEMNNNQKPMARR